MVGDVTQRFGAGVLDPAGGLGLEGKRCLVVGVANQRSIAWGCARALRAAGGRLVLTYLNDKARPHVAPLADAVGAELLLPLDVRREGELESLFARLREHWGGLDFLLHSIAYAPLEALHGRLTDCPESGFLEALRISCHSFIRMASLAEPLMQDGGSLLTLSYHGARVAVPNYGVMGPVKAALESTVRYLAAELGPSAIRVNALSPGPIATRAASGIKDFDALLSKAAVRAPLGRNVRIEEVGALAAFLAGSCSCALTGQIFYVDGGYRAVD